MKKWLKATVGLVLASSLALVNTPQAAAFSSGSSSFGSSTGSPEDFESGVKAFYERKGYEIVEAPALIAGYASKVRDEREVTYLPNGNGLFKDSFAHLLEGYSPSVSRLAHHGHNLRFDPASSVVMPADEGDKVAVEVVSDNTYYYVVTIDFNNRYQW